MLPKRWTITLACLTAVIHPLASDGNDGSSADECLADTRAAIAGIAKNYAGYPDKRTQLGAKELDASEQQARKAAANVTTREACDAIIDDYVGLFRDAHLSQLVRNQQDNFSRTPKSLSATRQLRSQAGAVSLEPTARLLSDESVVLTIPDFNLYYRSKLATLIRQFDSEMRQRPNLIIDLRGNSGGSDGTWQVLLPYLYTHPIVNVGVDARATRENADAWEAMGAQLPDTESASRTALMNAAQTLRSAAEGSFISLVEDSTTTLPEVLVLPSRIAILIDQGCASATEQFLLAARQSMKVRLFGQPSWGLLDYSNVRTLPLPSAQRLLGIATTRSRRLPKHPIDNIGIPPDVFIADLDTQQSSEEAVDFVLNYWKQKSGTR
ncbi:S41 family peptidase [Nevskia sp.]|uniref:S41 family peptidase n=1 Tax=Nevskia sp. TaxID=1929292 RepID=UPI0025EA969D|nr:S41 family peptidase [Nevskia sp.]